jgi:hypothetical protein
VRTTLHLADRIQRMPIVKERFADGVLAESALRLLADTWHDDIADTFARDEELLAGWAMTLAHRDFKIAQDRTGPHGVPVAPQHDERPDAKKPQASDLGFCVELRRIELLTSSMPYTCLMFAGVRRRSPNPCLYGLSVRQRSL